jgi:ribosomal protein S18 acetylase RimI-like enzyme
MAPERPNREGALLPALDYPAETLRLIHERRDALRLEGKEWADFYADSARRQVEEKTFLGLIWSGPGDEAVALAGWENAGQIGRRGWAHLAEGYRRTKVLEQFLALVESDSRSRLPFLSWSDDVAGLSDTDRFGVFTARGLYPVVRADMRFPREVQLPLMDPKPGFVVRPLTLADEEAIATLLFRVYTNSPERALFATTLDEEDDARKATHDLLHGGIGRWLPAASFGIELDRRLVALTLANELAGGLISEVGVDSSFRRQGLARQLLSRTVRALRTAGFDVPRLVVSMWNPQAVQLYKSMGFEFVPNGAGRLWINLKPFGISPPPAVPA